MSFPNLSAIGVKCGSVTLFLIMGIAIAGLLAFLRLGRAEDPSLTLKIVTITAAWPGATAREMQDQVADPLEKRLQELRYYDRVDTQARPGIVTLTLQMKDNTPPGEVPEEFYQARKKMADEAPNLPRGVIGPFVNDEYSDVYFALYALKARDFPERSLVNVAESVRSNLLEVPGVKKVRILGEQRQRIFIELSYQRLATLGISQEQMLAILQNQNLLMPAAEIQTGSQSISVRVAGAYDDLAAIRSTPIVANSRSFRLGDIATVERGYEDPPSYVIRHDGEPALMLGVVMRERYNGIELGKALAAQTVALGATLPLGLTLTKVSDQSENIAAAYEEFMIKFAVALVVVMVVSLITLGFRVGIVVAAAVPLTLGAVFVIMLITNKNFDRITLGALILSLGLLVDDAIIAIEMMVVKMEEGLDRIAASTFAWGATAAPMLAGTLVTVAGFLPIGFAQSGVGEYTTNIFWIVFFSLLMSWVVAVYFTPYLGVHLLPAIKPVPGGHDAIYATPRYRRLRAMVDWCVRHRRRVTIVTAAAFVAAGFLLALAVPKQFFPSADRSEVLAEVYMPKGTSIEATLAVVKRLETDIRAIPETRFVDSYVGAGAPRFYLALNPEPADPAFAKLVIRTAGPHERDVLRLKLEARVAQGAYPEARVRVTQLVFGPPVAYPVSFWVSGPNAGGVRDLASKVADIIRSHPASRGVNLDWSERAPNLRLAFDEDRLHLLGLDPPTVARQVQAWISGVQVSQVRAGNRTVDVVVRAPHAERYALGSLGDMTITAASGRSVPLSGVAQLVPDVEDPLLIRRDLKSMITVGADVTPGVQAPDVTADLLKAFKQRGLVIPPGYDVSVGGAAGESAKGNDGLAPLFPVMIGVMLLVIMVQTRSFRMTALTFATAPLGLIGATAGLLFTGKPFGFNAILGLIGLAGIIMRNTLILVDQIEAEQRRGLDAFSAVVEAAVRRSRPVLLTAMAAVLAFLPLTFSTFWGGLAVVLIGGTLVGTALSLFFLPALFALFFGVSAGFVLAHRGVTHQSAPISTGR
jgi:multidrug efflux pump